MKMEASVVMETYNGLWVGGYSARVNVEPNGHTSAQWLETAKKELGILW